MKFKGISSNKLMKKIIGIIVLLILITALIVFKKTPDQKMSDQTLVTYQYTGQEFQINIPEGWKYNDEIQTCGQTCLLEEKFTGPREVEQSETCIVESYPATLTVQKMDTSSPTNIFSQNDATDIPEFYKKYKLYGSLDRSDGYAQFVGPNSGAAPHCYQSRYTSSIHIGPDIAWIIRLDGDGFTQEEAIEIFSSFRL